MFTSITYLQSGNDKQQKVYDVLNKLNIMEDLALYSPRSLRDNSYKNGYASI